MKNPRLIVGAAAIGFSLSLLTGLFSGAFILVILLRALICAAVFGGLSFAVQILSDKFLTVEQPFTDIGKSQDAVSTGSKVDITIPEEDLTKEANGPQFFVNSQTAAPEPVKVQPAVSEKASVHTETVHTVQPVEDLQSPETESNAGPAVDPDETVPLEEPLTVPEETTEDKFVPVQLGSSAQVQQNSPEEKSSEPSSQSTVDNEQIDELPDLGDVAEDAGGDEDDGGIIQDSDFASQDTDSNDTAGTAALAKSKNSDTKDTALMAQAIRTVLANEQ